MSRFGRAGVQIAICALAVIGVVISIYLTIVHYNASSLVCVSTGVVNCERVLSSSFASVPYTDIPISIPGLLWFVVSGVLAALAWRVWPERKPLYLAQVAWTGLGMLTVLYLVYVEIVRLHALCAWCTALHIMMFIMFILAIIGLQNADTDEEAWEEEENEVLSEVSHRS